MAPDSAHNKQITMYLQSFLEMFLFWLKKQGLFELTYYV